MTRVEYPGFVGRLRETRERQGLSQRGLSQKAGRSNSWVCSLEAGLWLPDAQGAACLAKVLGVTMEWLLTGEDPKGGSK